MKTLFSLLITFHVSLFTFDVFAQWQPDVRLTNDTSSSVTSTGTFSTRSIASSGNFAHVVWRDFRDANNEIYYKRSTDGGASWGADTRLTNNSFSSLNPSVSVSGSIVHVVWSDTRDGLGEIYYKRSTDGGISWGGDTRLTDEPARSETPSLFVSGSVAHVVWDDNRDGNREIYYKRSTDGGVSWGADTRLTNAVANSFIPSVSVSGSVVHVAWNDNRNTNQEIYYKRSTDGGVSWESDMQLTNIAISFNPSISVSGLIVQVVWYDTRDGNQEIYHKRSTDGGVSWGADTRLTNNAGSSRIPSITSSTINNIVHIVWYDNSDGNNEIYYKRSTDAGVSWEADTRLTDNSFSSLNPSISVSGSTVQVVWQDNRDGNNEIYYKHNLTGNLQPPLTPTSLTALAVSSSRINLNWTDNSSNETGFKIERSTNAGTNWILKDSVFQNIINYSDSGLTSNTIYHYRIYAYNPAGNSPYSNTAFDTTLNLVGITPVSNEIPKNYSLSQNYPNPFNPMTKLKFQMPNSGFVQLKIFDVLGREVATLVNEQLNAGTYEIVFNGSNLGSGVYYYKLTSGDFTDIKKMILIK